MQQNRRDFLKGCAAAGLGAGCGRAFAFFDPQVTTGGKAAGNNVIVYLFLRGAIDGLHLIVPHGAEDPGTTRWYYKEKRGPAGLAIPNERLRPIGSTGWAWHPRAGGGVADAVTTSPKWLEKLYNANRLGVMQATGMPTPNRSHFESQAMMEMGTPGSTGSSTGWLARYLTAATGLPEPLIAPAMGFSGNLQTSLIGLDSAVSLANAQSFRVDGFHWGWNDSRGDFPVGHPDRIQGHQGAFTRLFPLWNGDSSLETAGRTAAEALEYMRGIDFGLHSGSNTDGYQPEGGAVYPTDELGVQMRNLAQLIKLDTGVVAAAVDYGFWDTHEGQGMPQPGNANQYDWFGNLTEGLGRALDAFYTDLNASPTNSQAPTGETFMSRVTVVIQSEFGRRFAPNQSAGTDHGFGNIMMALGNNVNGGQLHGTFPGLDDLSLKDGQDLDVTTDFRQVLSEALVKHMALPTNRIAQVFPGYTYNAGGSNLFQT